MTDSLKTKGQGKSEAKRGAKIQEVLSNKTVDQAKGQEVLSQPSQQQKKEHSRSLFFQSKKQMEVSWYIKLNIMVIGFLFVLFLIQKIQSPIFQAGLSRLFADSPSSSPPPSGRVVKIQPPPVQ